LPEGAKGHRVIKNIANKELLKLLNLLLVSIFLKRIFIDKNIMYKKAKKTKLKPINPVSANN